MCREVIEMFKAVQFMTAKEKELVLKRWRSA
jgi:hypothetical protein